MTSASGWLLDVNGEHCSEASTSRAILTWSLTPVPQAFEGREDSPSPSQCWDKPVYQVEIFLIVCSNKRLGSSAPLGLRGVSGVVGTQGDVGTLPGSRRMLPVLCSSAFALHLLIPVPAFLCEHFPSLWRCRENGKLCMPVILQ